MSGGKYSSKPQNANTVIWNETQYKADTTAKYIKCQQVHSNKPLSDLPVVDLDQYN